MRCGARVESVWRLPYWASWGCSLRKVTLRACHWLAVEMTVSPETGMHTRRGYGMMGLLQITVAIWVYKVTILALGQGRTIVVFPR